jgi:Mce-associated membrane protein
MTDEGTETGADATAVEEADHGLDATTETVEAAATDGSDSETTAVDESLVFTTAEKPAGKRWVLLAAAGVCAVLLASTGALGWQVWQQHQIAKASQEAQRAAVSYAQVLTSIDSNKVDENFKDVLDGATGEFKDMYSQSSVELRQLLVENKATAHGVVVDSAVQEASKNKAVVLLFVDQSVTNTKLPDPRIDRSRMKMTLEKVDGRWRASKVELP